MLLPLPASISACLPTIQWPLGGPSSSPPMHYEPLDVLQKRRSAEAATAAAQAATCSTSHSPIDTIVTDIPAALSAITASTATPTQTQHSQISLALLLLGHGYADECHDLITPLSWSDDTSFGYGPSVYSQTEPSAIAAASYAHSLVHRKEGSNIGEYGMMGYSNANYWSSATYRSSGGDAIPYKEMREEILKASKGNEAAERWCQERIIEEGGENDSYWESRALHELCARVSQLKGAAGGEEEGLKEFAERACEVELRVLLRHCLIEAGYDAAGCVGSGGGVVQVEENSSVNDLNAPVCSKVNENAALVGGNKVSSAHLNSFRSNGSITIRNLLKPDRQGNIDKNMANSVMAGVAARLLEAPAVRVALDTETRGLQNEEDCVRILLSTNEYDAEATSKALGATAGGGSLSSGDLFAVACVEGTSDDLLDAPNVDWTIYVACTVTDPRATFADRLWGSKGETPTTVIQWSKGTIHKSQ